MDLLYALMNTSQETERLQTALAGLATVMTKMVNERVEQALAESLPARLPTGADSNNGNRFASDRLLNKKQVAELLNVTPRCVDGWMSRGLLPYYKIGRSVRFRAGDVVRHLDETALVARCAAGARG